MFHAKIYGAPHSRATRQARRFFAEAGTPARYINLTNSPIPSMELRRFVDKFTLAAIVDSDSPSYAALLGKRDSIPDGELFANLLTNSFPAMAISAIRASMSWALPAGA